MLHILWILIKIILIILGILLGLALLAVLLLLFCPVRYQAKAVKETDSFRETELEARVTWLFHAIGARASFCNGERKLAITLFGVSLETIKGWLAKLKGSKKKSAAGKKAKSRSKKKAAQKDTGKKVSAQKPVPEKLVAEELSSEEPASEKSAAEELSSKEATSEKSAAEELSSKEATSEKSAAESSSSEKPSACGEPKHPIADEKIKNPSESTEDTKTEKVTVIDVSSAESEKSKQIPVSESTQQEMDTSRNLDEPEGKTIQPEESPEEAFRPEKPKAEMVQVETSGGRSQTEKTAQEQEEKDNEPASSPGLFTRIRGILSKILRLPGNLWNKITAVIKGIVEKFRNIKKIISGITSRVGWWKEFLTNERTKAALSLVWKDAKGLIRHVLPTKVEGQVTFGCDDPAITGTVLAVLGMTFPFHQNRIQVTPLFDGENQLTGNVFLKGRIYGIMFIKAAIEIYFNKNIKYVINRWKHKED